MNIFHFLSVALVMLTTSTSLLAADEHPITIGKNPPKITRRAFDPKRPPAEMPKLNPPESGVCHFEFTSDAGIGTFTDQIDPHTVEVEIDSFDVVLDLAVDVWAMNGAPKKLISHEEGHRQICEYYYKDADAIARRLAQSMIGRKARGTGENKDAAAKKAMDALLSEFNLTYMNETKVRCSACFKRYDEITHHGLLPISEADAIQQAIAAEPASEVKPQAATPASKANSP